MSGPELLALSLVLSVAASALAWIAGALIERASPDPRLRDRIWGAGLLLGAVPPLAVAALLLAPAPVREIAAPTIVTAPVLIAPTLQAGALPPPAALPDLAILASLGLAAAVALGLLRLVSLGVRIGRLMRLVRHAAPADPDLTGRVEALSRGLQVRPPRTVTSATIGEALLSGLGRPCLILPQAPDAVASDAVIAHELAHLKRGDHRTLWLEEALVVLLAINPLVPVLRARRDAAREEACDALALRNAEPETRRVYARTLIEALRTRAGPRAMGDAVVALTFTGAGRTSAMSRLKAVMTPAAPAGRRARLVAALGALGLFAAAGGATAAVVSHRAMETRIAPVATSRADRAPEAAAAAADHAGSEAARQATEAARAALPVDARRRFASPSAADYQRFCGSADALDEGFCAGVLFASLGGDPKAGLCLPEIPADDHAAVTAYLARAQAEIARLEPRRDEGAYEYSERALRAAYPCATIARPAAMQSPALPRTYQARLTISVSGQVVATERLRMLPDNRNASTILTADGRDYRFELRLARAEPAPDEQQQLALDAEVTRAASAGGWEPEARPALLMRPDGTARMQWGSEAGLGFEILVEPA